MVKKVIVPNTLAVLMTYQCNAACEMCCFSCDPYRSERMPDELYHKIIREISSDDSIHTVGFSGGEPFLDIERLIKFVTVAKSAKKRVTCATNGFWGKDIARANEILYKLKGAGLSKISISVDLFHQKYIDISCVKNVLRSCEEVGVQVDVGSVLTSDTKGIGHLLDEVQVEMINTVHYRAACLPVGRAKERIKDNDYIIDEGIFRKKNRCFETTYIAVYPDGKVYPCCSQAGMIPALCIGDIKTDSFEEIKKKYNKNMYIRILKQYGASWFLKVLNDKEFSKISGERFVNKCHLCNRLLSDNEIIKKNEDAINHEKEKIYLAYMRGE